MTIDEMIERFPVCAPPMRLGRYGIWFFDERWRLPYRWCELKLTDGFGLMLFGAGISVMKLAPKPKGSRTV